MALMPIDELIFLLVKTIVKELLKMQLIRCTYKLCNKFFRAKNFFRDVILPFFTGLITVITFLWLQQLFSRPVNNNRMENIFKSQFVRVENHGSSYNNIQKDSADANKGTGDHRSYEEVWSWSEVETNSKPSPVWVVTPTYRNPYQYAELTRIAQALYPARNFVRWLIVDDTGKSKSSKSHLRNLQNYLKQFSIQFSVIPSQIRLKNQLAVHNPKGVDCRRTALKYIREKNLTGTVYFADDDNTYDTDIFRQMQDTKVVSVWPTGAITQWSVSSPIVNDKGKVVDFFDAYVTNRRFPLDFASFAFNASLLLHQGRHANMPFVQSYQETIFLRTLNVSIDDFRPLCLNATKILTWHTKTYRDILLLDASNNEIPSLNRRPIILSND